MIAAGPHGNLVVSVLESRRPRVFELVDVVPGELTMLDPRFVECCAPGTLQIVSVVSPHLRRPMTAELLQDETGGVAVRVCAGPEFYHRSVPGFKPYGERTTATVMILGTHRHFPDWDLPVKSDTDRQRSWNFWSQEWTDH